ncbi:MAG: tryptophan synthase subunit alpha [Thaumarchaeota archaeon]|nr:tryptophan synthase subunit alpha [Nitrososphaerota archaeon]|tara:strand:+ start:2632 stop:3438 length:807 start_codon:yes stop_codon:yes gene_type:complete
MNIAEKFKEGKEQNKSLLIGFITAGDPSIELTSKLAEAMVKGGVDIIELGIPFSDPIADGPTIQSSSMRSLSNGTTTKDILDTSKKIVENLNVPVVLLTYYNTIMKIGTDVFLQEAAKAKISGIVSPDLPPEEGKEYIKLARGKDIDTIFLASPATNNLRLDNIIDSTSGFLYMVSLFGVTGTRDLFNEYSSDAAKRIVKRVNGRIPVAIGFGISKPEHVKHFTKLGVDGVIVGSAFIKIIEENSGNTDVMINKLNKLSLELSQATNN